MKAQKHEGHYVCACGSADSDAQEVRNQGFDIFTHGHKRTINPFSMVITIIRLRRILKQQNIDALVCHTPLGGFLGRLAGYLAGLNHVIYFVHGLPCAPSQSRVKWTTFFLVEKCLATLTQAFVVMNDYDERLCRDRLARQDAKVCRIIGMGVDLKKFSYQDIEVARTSVQEEFSLVPDTKIIFAVAFLVRQKGIWEFYEAARQISTQRDDVCFMLAGTGPLEKALRKAVHDNNLSHRLIVLGWRNDIDRLMKASDIFVLPTYYFEGLPVSILEAMACGKPVITTHHRGSEDVVVDGTNGFLIPIKQTTPLVNKILHLLGDEQLRQEMGKAGRQRVEQHFELSSCTDKIVEVLERACKK
jgi:glycosyltransferase involved in cell wall biosynthesis